MPNGVSCAVDTCKYWEKDNKCSAASIQIQTDYAALLRQLQNSEFATEIGYANPDVRHSVDTCCKTYKLKANKK